jgi:hypothetical protein
MVCQNAKTAGALIPALRVKQALLGRHLKELKSIV